MAFKCAHCRSADVGACFNTFQCFSCGGETNMDGTKTVPTSALETETSTYDGPGAELIDDPDNLPFRAKDPVR